MKPGHIDVDVFVNGTQIVCQVPTRVLDQLASMDDLHSCDAYYQIAMANIRLIEAAVAKKLPTCVDGMPLRLERTDFPNRL